jgi:hypothetical protein
VTLPVLDGHRDTNDTACPGKNLYAALPAIRRRTKAVMDQAAAPAAAAITTPFTVTGTPVDGEQLTVRPGAWTPATAVPTYTWMRDGVAVTGTTTAAYLLTAADVGAAITVRVDIAPTGVQPATQTLAFPAPVKARPVLVVRAVGRPHRAVVRVVATAAGLDGPVTGTVRMSIAGHSQTVALVDGRARVVFRLLKAGTYAAAVSYPGSTTTAPGSGTAMATVT